MGAGELATGGGRRAGVRGRRERGVCLVPVSWPGIARRIAPGLWGFAQVIT
ncbi:hypothetical protein [Kineosporia succinea]|uniref:Uncharacterized protein n=1 Tax=Kineosporia succinea TaxID=84632 RepID=A0ABT9NYC3_9ACTN|nr:hypothetical protein [Kineosporia succinea]MDP9825443.1 hypothetical protein [Kineosporia succinea]